MTSDPRLDSALREFLGHWQVEQNAGHTIANLRLEIHELRVGGEPD